jgi:hypothetical protein
VKCSVKAQNSDILLGPLIFYALRISRPLQKISFLQILVTNAALMKRKKRQEAKRKFSCYSGTKQTLFSFNYRLIIPGNKTDSVFVQLQAYYSGE